MTIHILVEGPSERAFLEPWVSRLLPEQRIHVHPHQGKGSLPRRIDAQPDRNARSLLAQLPAKLRSFAAFLNSDVDSVLILLDADSDNVTVMGNEIAKVARQCSPNLKVGITFAIEETEAFYLGDLRALESAYPDADFEMARAYTPDSIVGTWELFGKIVGDDGGNKVAWAEAMGPRLATQPAHSRSPSFRGLIRKLHSLVPAPKAPAKRAPYRHVAKNKKPGNRR
jgi:hypothetical protein